MAEDRWKNQESEMERNFKERMKSELEMELMEGANSHVKQEHPKRMGDTKPKQIDTDRQEVYKLKDDKDSALKINKSIKSLKVDKMQESFTSNIKTDSRSEEKDLGQKVSKVSTTKNLVRPKEHEGFHMKPYIGTFSGSEPKPKNESSFEDFKLEVESLIATEIYSDVSIAQAIRKALKGQAKKVLLTMGPLAKPSDMVNRIESVLVT